MAAPHKQVVAVLEVAWHARKAVYVAETAPIVVFGGVHEEVQVFLVAGVVVLLEVLG